MIKIKYKDWYEVDLDDTHHLRKKDTSEWLQKDFTLFIRFKSNWSEIKKTEDENIYCCIVGKPGLHAGVSVAENQIYKFDFWVKDPKTGDPMYNSIALNEPTIDEGHPVDMIVGHDLESKKFYICVYQHHNGQFEYNEKTYESEIIDYTWCPTYVGCAYHDEETGYPHNSFWAGEIYNLKIVDRYIEKGDIEECIFFDYETYFDDFDKGRYFEFDGKKQTQDSIFDISHNNNHLRKQRQLKLTKYNKAELSQDSKTSIL